MQLDGGGDERFPCGTQWLPLGGNWCGSGMPTEMQYLKDLLEVGPGFIRS